MIKNARVRAVSVIGFLICIGVVLALVVLALVVFFLWGMVDDNGYVRRVRTKIEIDRMIIGVTEYFNEFNAYPPGGVDVNDDGDLDDTPGDDLGSGKLPADPAKPTIAELQLRTIAMELPAEQGARTVGPYYRPDMVWISNGAIVDLYGNPLRYLADGRRTTIDPATNRRLPGRVFRRGPVIWSVGRDGKQDPQNNNRDDDYDGKVDELDEMKDDICSWH